MLLRFLRALINGLCNPTTWVSLLGPWAIQAALRLVQADVSPNVASNVQFAKAGNPMAIETLVGSSEMKIILDYALQVNTVVFAFSFWVFALFADNLYGFSKEKQQYLFEKMHTNPTVKVKLAIYAIYAYVVSALLIIILVIHSFPQCGHLAVVKLYNPSVAMLHPRYLNWFFWFWNIVDGPPWASPLTWIRGALFVHGTFRGLFKAACSSVDLSLSA